MWSDICRTPLNVLKIWCCVPLMKHSGSTTGIIDDAEIAGPNRGIGCGDTDLDDIPGEARSSWRQCIFRN